MEKQTDFSVDLFNLHKSVMARFTNKNEIDNCGNLKDILDSCVSEKGIMASKEIKNYLIRKMKQHHDSLKNEEFELNKNLTINPTGKTSQKIETIVNKSWNDIKAAAEAELKDNNEKKKYSEISRKHLQTLKTQLTDSLYDVIKNPKKGTTGLQAKFKVIENKIKKEYPKFTWEILEQNHFIGGNSTRSFYKMGKKAQYLFALIDAIETFSQEKEKGFDKTGALGASLEEMLQMLSDYGITAIETAVKEGTVNDLFKKGSGTTPAGLSSVKEELYRNESSTKHNIRISSTDGYELEVKWDPYTDRQGKMDVEFNMTDKKDNSTGIKTDDTSIPKLRISAKNWGGSLSSHDFGSTGFTYAIARTLGNEKMESLVTALATSNALDYAHKLAKYSLFADILMGYSQTNLYADTIVINCQGKGFLVFPLSSVFDEINKQKNPPLKDYDDKIWIDNKLTTTFKKTVEEKQMDNGEQKTIKKEQIFNIQPYDENRVWDLIVALSRIDIAVRYNDISAYIPEKLRLKN